MNQSAIQTSTFTTLQLLSVDEDKFRVFFVHDSNKTYCLITTDSDKECIPLTTGYSCCNPSDTYSQALGEKIAMRRACRIGKYPFKSSWYTAIYSAYRLNIYENGKAE